jgi:hypothetical protein
MSALTRSGALTYVCQGFDPYRTRKAVSKYSCTALIGIPTMFS